MFQFKQFAVKQQHCAMKVGTDGVLLGAWAEVSHAKKVLDLGTGTGLIALMVAQRTALDCQITAIEMDSLAYQQARENFQASPWAERLTAVYQEALPFLTTTTQRFDVILSNPPYFPVGCECRTPQRSMARYQQNSHIAWLHAAQNCLTPTGQIHLILPYDQGLDLLAQSTQTALFCHRQIKVVTKQGKLPRRWLFSFQLQATSCEQGQLIIYNEDNQYHQDYVSLTQDFYLHAKMSENRE